MANVMITETAHSYVDVQSGTRIDAWFAPPGIKPVRSCLAEHFGFIRSEFIEVSIESLDAPPASLADVYLRFHLLSRTTVAPNGLNLAGMFGLLTNVAWTTAGPCLPTKVDELRTACAASQHHLGVPSIDKIPRMTDYVTPSDVRIGDADRVRLGAHLASGTTVMHEGFVNFNAGSLGPAMIEGRVTPGVAVGANSDIGAGSSIMGTLSGGGKQVNSVGENSLLGANAGIGISLGDRCIVEAGLYLTAGTKVTLADGQVLAARELSGRNDLLFRRNSLSGAVEVVPSGNSNWGGLNTALHSN